jgi:hypothetical protein
MFRRHEANLMGLLALIQTSGTSQPIPLQFWIGLGVTVLPTLVGLALMTVFRKEFPNKDQFAHLCEQVEKLETKLTAIPSLVEKVDYKNREDRNAEFGRFRDSVDLRAHNNENSFRELRELLAGITASLNAIRDGQHTIEKDFSVFEKEAQMRLKALEEYRRQQEEDHRSRHQVGA